MATTVNNPVSENMNRVNNPANVGKINDFGKKIGGARKDLAREAAEMVARMMGATADMINNVGLAKIARIDQLEKLFTEGAITGEAACAAVAVFRTIGKKNSVWNWAEKAAEKLKEIAAIIDGGEITENVKRLPDYLILQAVGYPETPFSFGKLTVEGSKVRDYYGAQERDYYRVICGRRYIFRSYDISAVAEYIYNTVKASEDKKSSTGGSSLGPTFEIRYNYSHYYICPKNRRSAVLWSSKSQDEARAMLRNRDELLKLWAEYRAVPELRRTTNRPRSGEDYRHGESVTPEKFAQAFPFYGVEFGNWLNQADRLTRLNETYDALRDLCKLCGLTADAATLTGWLSMAFGSRGIPGAAAHYETLFRVINLTKEHGAGSLAHEWFHALDNFTACRFGLDGAFATKDYARLPEGEIREAARALYTALNKSPFAKRSTKLDEHKDKIYYGTTIEMAARAFEVYVIELAKNQGMTNDFLANITYIEDWGKKAELYPYPTAAEVAELAPAFARFLTACADAQELSQDAEELFARGRAIMDEQRAQEEERKAAAEAEQIALREQQKAERMAEMEQKAQEVKAECGATWSFCFDSCGKPYAVGGGAGFIFIIWHSMHVGYRVCQYNKRLRKEIRACWQYVLQVKPGVNLEEFAKKDLQYGFTMRCQFSEVYHMYASTWSEFCEKHGDELKKAAQEFAPVKKVEKKAEKKSETAPVRIAASRKDNSKAETKKAVSDRKNDSSNKKERKELDMTAAPYAGLKLIEIEGGVAVVPVKDGDWKATLYNKRYIKAHGAKWNADAQQWQATDVDGIAQLREWFKLQEAA